MERGKSEEVEEGSPTDGTAGGEMEVVGAKAGVAVVSKQNGDESAVAEPRAPRPRSFADMLVESGMLSVEQVAKSQEYARREGLPLTRVLVRDGLVLSRDLAAFMALHLGLTMVDLRSESLDPEVVGLIPQELATRYTALPLRKENGTLTVAMADPTDLQVIQDLTARTGLSIEPEVATDTDLLENIDVAYRLVRQRERELAASEDGGEERLTADTLRSAQPANFVDMLLEAASHDGASDIHIEPTENHLRIRFRIDGVMQETMTLPMDIHPTLISRIKILSGLNIAERRKPQDGQLSFEAEGKKTDVRTAVCNTIYGEMAVLRLLDSGALSSLGLDQLGMIEGLEKYQEILKLPDGMVIISGPTGSGKSTTLAASVMTIDRTVQNVITMEDPVENELPDANQLQVHTEAGVTFATLLRSILRLDPDVILVGECRDPETAELAIESALTGHLVLSTVHANDSVSTLLRLKDLGVPSYLIASAMKCIVAQRMVRKVCTGCATMVPRPLSEQGIFFEEIGEKQEAFIYGAGCNACAGSGYRGRSGIYEIMIMTDDLTQLFMQDAPRHELWVQTLKDGTIPLRKDGMMKVKMGITTPEEVIRKTQE